MKAVAGLAALIAVPMPETLEKIEGISLADLESGPYRESEKFDLEHGEFGGRWMSKVISESMSFQEFNRPIFMADGDNLDMNFNFPGHVCGHVLFEVPLMLEGGDELVFQNENWEIKSVTHKKASGESVDVDFTFTGRGPFDVSLA